MPELPTKTPKPKVKRGAGPDSLPYGGAAQVNAASAGAPGSGQAQVPGGADFSAASLQPQEAQPLQGDLTGFDNVLFGSSDRPDEPITEGAPFGEGSNFRRGSVPSAEDQLKIMVEKIAKDPTSTPRTRAFLARVIKGQ